MHLLRKVYFTSFIFSFNLALTAYINSSFIGNHLGETHVGIMFSLAALATFIGLQYLPKILTHTGNRKAALMLLSTGIFSLWMLINQNNPLLIGIFFVLYIASNNLMVYSLDIFVEHFSKNTDTGRARGLYLTITNLAWMLSPFVAGTLLTNYGFPTLYSVVLVLLLIVVFLMTYTLKTFKDSHYVHMSLSQGFQFIKKRPQIARIIAINFFLQFFFSWMIVFTPIYLHTVIGFGFDTIGIIFMIMLAPFVLFQFPLGYLADKKWGEKEMLIIGFVIMALSTFVFASYRGHAMYIWAAILFMTRVGASTIEVMTETFFFKQIDDNEPEVISLFRTTTPLAFVMAPLIGSFLLESISFPSLYIILGILITIGLTFTFKLKDTA